MKAPPAIPGTAGLKTLSKPFLSVYQLTEVASFAIRRALCSILDLRTVQAAVNSTLGKER
jgi:hypothetical protein